MRDEFTGDFSTIEEMDPSVADGFRVIYDREVSFWKCNEHLALSFKFAVWFLIATYIYFIFLPYIFLTNMFHSLS